jgi:hypothetical protein
MKFISGMFFGAILSMGSLTLLGQPFHPKLATITYAMRELTC